jgi:phage replication O-like protein O
MASPQPDIFVRYSKELLRAKAKLRISGVQNQLWEAVMLLSYGANPPKKEIEWNTAEIQEITGLSRTYVWKARSAMLKMKVLKRTKKGTDYVEMIGINKNYDQWKPVPKKVRTNIGTNPYQKRYGSRFLPILGEENKDIGDDEISKPSTSSPLRAYSYPSWLDRELWAEYHRMRAKIKRPITSLGTITRLMNKLKELIDAGYAQQDIFAAAIDNSWRSFYKPKGQQVLGSTKSINNMWPVCMACGQQADNIIKGQPCPFCGGTA